MTTEELEREFDYRVAERLGILCANATPTTEQYDIAVREAKETVEKLRNEI